MPAKTIILTIFSTCILSCTADPANLKYQTNLLDAIEMSKIEKKPLFIHFTGYGSMGFNEFRDDLITSPTIQNMLNNDFITVELYTDDQTKLEPSDTLQIHKIITSPKGKHRLSKARTIGNINTALQIEILQSNNQPQYVATDSNLTFLIPYFGYTNQNKKHFTQQLKKPRGILNFEYRIKNQHYFQEN